MKVSRLLEQHQKFRDQGLNDSFGDGYLMMHNLIFKNVRQAALAEGFKFSSERDEAYETFPLLQLERLLLEKVLPYANNVVALQSLTKGQLTALTWEDIDGNLKKNFVFHEACHAVVRGIAHRHLDPLGAISDFEGQRKLVTRMLLEESCSNTCELLGVTEASDQMHRIFYEMNSYVCEFESRTHLKNAMSEIGASVVVRFMVLAYMQANFLRERLEEGEFQQMLKMVTDSPLDLKHQKTLRALGKVAFNLSERFRYQTTSFHLRLAGIETPLEDIFDFPFLLTIQRDKGFQGFLKEFAETIL